MPNGGQGAQKLRIEMSLHIGEDKEYYKVLKLTFLVFYILASRGNSGF